MKQFALILSLALVSGFQGRAQTFVSDFVEGYDGWSGDFADYPITDSVFYQLAFNRTTLPAPLNTAKHALMITGSNHSDDLFMFIKKKITGLQPNTTYMIKIDVEFASRAPTNGVGVGGAPGEGVTMKAGATLIEPMKQVEGSNYRMNINKANQAMPGPDMDTIGHVGVTDTTTVFALINRSNSTHQFTFTTNASGEAWVCIGTDSGFEAITTLYYNKITLTFTSGSTGIGDPEKDSAFYIFPNPAQNKLMVKSDHRLNNAFYLITDMLGKTVISGTLGKGVTTVNTAALSPGTYLFCIPHNGGRAIRWVKK